MKMLYKWVREFVEKFSFVEKTDFKHNIFYIWYKKNGRSKAKHLPYGANKQMLLEVIDDIKKDINYIEIKQILNKKVRAELKKKAIFEIVQVIQMEKIDEHRIYAKDEDKRKFQLITNYKGAKITLETYSTDEGLNNQNIRDMLFNEIKRMFADHIRIMNMEEKQVRQMVKIVHIKILDGEVSDVKAIREQLKGIKEYKFLITNDRIEINDIGKLLDEFYTLYKQYKKTKK